MINILLPYLKTICIIKILILNNRSNNFFRLVKILDQKMEMKKNERRILIDVTTKTILFCLFLVLYTKNYIIILILFFSIQHVIVKP